MSQQRLFRGELQPLYHKLPIAPSPQGWKIYSNRSGTTYYIGKSPHVARLMYNVIGQRLIKKGEEE